MLQTAVKVETHSCRHATKKANLEKNQNQKCIPCKYKRIKILGLMPLSLKFFCFLDDYNRVVLETIEGEPDSDYVNASHVDVSCLTKISCLNIL